MSDALILGLSTIISASIITPLVAFLIKRIDAYHKEINSKLTRLVEAEKTISHDKGKEEGIVQGTAEGLRQAEVLISYDKGKEGKTNGPNKEPEKE